MAQGFPSIDLYVRPRKERQRSERLDRAEKFWIGGALVLALMAQGVIFRDQMALGSMLSVTTSEIGKLQIQKSAFERARTSYSQQAEKSRGIEGTLAARTGWLRLLQAVSSATSDREALEQCTMDGRLQRSITMTGSAVDLQELQAMIQRLKAIPVLKSIRLLETAADKSMGKESIHFRIEARCDAADLNRGAPAR